MSTRRRRKPVVLQAAELAFAAPQVVAHRVARMAGAGLAPGLRDRSRSYHDKAFSRDSHMSEKPDRA